MARRNTPEPEKTPPSVSPAKGIELIERQIREGEALASKVPFVRESYSEWRIRTDGVLSLAYGSAAHEKAVFHNAAAASGPDSYSGLRGFDPVAEDMQKLKAQLVALRAFVKLLNDRVELEGEATPPTPPNPAPAVNGRKVFIVHGRDPFKHEVAHFVEKLKLKAVILDQEANKGRTLLTKFEEESSDAAFAVVLVTGDDVGALAADLEGKTSEEKVKLLRRRPRQNVVFELGYFRGRLGAERVCALVEPGVEMPSDVAGLVTIAIDKGWKFELAKEMKAAKLPVDLNDAV